MKLEQVHSRKHIPQYLIKNGLLGRWCELGVCRGEYSSFLLSRANQLGSPPSRLFSIDRWTSERGHDVSQYMKAVRSLTKFTNCSIIRASFEDVVSEFSDGFFDFIYIDGYAHSGQDSGRHLREWFPKLKKGGLFAGHDYHRSYPQTKKAVNEFAKLHDLSFHVTNKDRYNSWLIQT